VIGTQGHDDALHPDVALQPIEQFGQKLIQPQHVVLPLQAVRSVCVADVVGRRQAEEQDIGCRALAKLDLGHRFLGQFDQQPVSQWHESQRG
jgi:hypothetical protein